jgi:hypothetical protein
MGTMRNAYTILVLMLKGRDRLEDVELWVKWMLMKQEVRMWIGFIWLRIGMGGGSRQHGSEPSSLPAEESTSDLYALIYLTQHDVTKWKALCLVMLLNLFIRSCGEFKL